MRRRAGVAAELLALTALLLAFAPRSRPPRGRATSSSSSPTISAGPISAATAARSRHRRSTVSRWAASASPASTARRGAARRAPRCSPGCGRTRRASVISPTTGVDPDTAERSMPPYPRSRSACASHGYSTHMVGKWHLTTERPADGETSRRRGRGAEALRRRGRSSEGSIRSTARWADRAATSIRSTSTTATGAPSWPPPECRRGDARRVRTSRTFSANAPRAWCRNSSRPLPIGRSFSTSPSPPRTGR